MAKEKFQITLPESAAQILKQLSEQKGFSKSVIVAMALHQLAETEQQKGEVHESK